VGSALLLPADRQLLSLTARLRRPYGGGPDAVASQDTLQHWQNRNIATSSGSGPVLKCVLGEEGEAEYAVVPPVRPLVFKGDLKSSFSVGTFVASTKVPPRQGVDADLPKLESQLERIKPRLDLAWEESIGRQRAWIAKAVGGFLEAAGLEGDGEEDAGAFVDEGQEEAGADEGQEVGGGVDVGEEEQVVVGKKRTAEEKDGASKRTKL
jgi:hypothetical protein